VSVALAETPAFAAGDGWVASPQAGARVHGGSDPVFRTIDVLAWDDEDRHR
jgi:hypothetical protein